MALTRANLEAMLVARVGPWLAKAGMDATTVDGTNQALNDPIRVGLRETGVAVADPTAVTDADVAGMDAASELDEVLDRAELRALRTVQRNYTRASISLGSGAVQTYGSDLLRQITAILVQAQSDVRARWGPGSGESGAGVLNLGFGATDEG